MAKINILIVEDEEDILGLIKYNLSKEGYEVCGTPSGEEALKIINTAKVPHDLIILDLMLPDIDGLEICRRIKNNATTRNIPVIMLTARGEEIDIVTGLEVGADDYITKPFSPRVLVARIRTILRREKNTVQDTEVIKIRDLTINTNKREVYAKTDPIKLTRNEFQALHLLASRPGQVFSRYQIIEGIRGDNYDVTDRAVDVLITGLRKKLGSVADYIETVHGIGYKFKE